MNTNFNPNFGINLQYKAKKNNKSIITIVCIVLVIVVMIVGYLLFSGSKTLTCTRVDNMYDMAMTGVVKIYFKGNRVKLMNMKINVNLGEYLEYKDAFIESFEEEYQSYKEKGIEVNITSDDSNVYAELIANKENFKATGISSSENYTEVKLDLEKQGFICK